MKLKNFWPAIVWAIFVLIICNRSLGSLAENPVFFKGFDKLTHTGLFFVFTILLCFGLIKNSGKMNLGADLAVLIGGIAFGGIIELLQLYIFTWRSGEWADLFCDTIGIGMGLFAVFSLQKAREGYEK